MHTSGDITKRFRITRQTLANWCSEFRSFLSTSANPGHGEHRRFTDEDLSVLALIQSMKRMNMTNAEVHISLGRGNREEPPDHKDIVAADSPLALAQNRISELEEMIEMLIEERNTLRIDKAMLERRETELTAAQAEIARLNREIGRLQGKLDV